MSAPSSAPLNSVKPTRVLVATGLFVLVSGAAVIWPLVAHHVRQREELRSFQVADDSLQIDIVRAYLEHELHRPPLIVAGRKLEEVLYFDTKAAALCSLDHPTPCDQLEFLSAERDGALVDAADITMPVELQRLLDRITSLRTYNIDPRVTGVTTLGTTGPENLAEACAGHPSRQARLVRISRGAVSASDGRAIAMVLDRYCDNSGGMHVIKFHREGAKWVVTAEEARK